MTFVIYSNTLLIKIILFSFVAFVFFYICCFCFKRFMVTVFITFVNRRFVTARTPKTINDGESLVDTIYIVIEHEFLKWFRNFENVEKNKFRINHEQKRKYKAFLTNFIKKGITPKLRNWRNRAINNFVLQDGQLYHFERTKSNLRRMIMMNDVWEFVWPLHVQSGHMKRDKTWTEIRDKYYEIIKKKMIWIIDHCELCNQNKPFITKTPLTVIFNNNSFERVQMNFINMKIEPDGIYTWILHAKINEWEFATIKIRWHFFWPESFRQNLFFLASFFQTRRRCDWCHDSLADVLWAYEIRAHLTQWGSVILPSAQRRSVILSDSQWPKVPLSNT